MMKALNQFHQECLAWHKQGTIRPCRYGREKVYLGLFKKYKKKTFFRHLSRVVNILNKVEAATILRG